MLFSVSLGQRIRRLPIANAWSDTKIVNVTRSNENFTVAESTSANAAAMTYRGRSSGRFYAEIGLSATGVFDCAFGLRLTTEAIATAVNAGQTMCARSDASVYAGATGATAGTGGTFSSGQRGMLAVDFAAGKLWLGANGTWFNSGDPVAGTGALFTSVPIGEWHLYWWCDNNAAGSHTAVLYNGQAAAAFAHTKPDGFNAGLLY